MAGETEPLFGKGQHVDEEFPASNESLYENGVPPEDTKVVGWKRPREMTGVEKPQLFVDGARRGDVHQGDLGDCWFLSACAAVVQGRHVKSSFSSTPDRAWVLHSLPNNQSGLIEKVIPEGQTLDGDNYTGKVSFKFWNMGSWVPVEIDDMLPVDVNDRLVYASCEDRDEFWLPLLEKAYAKFHGKYYRLESGTLEDGLHNLTGAILTTSITEEKGLFKRMGDEFNAGSVILCGSREVEKSSIIQRHVYTVTGLASFMQGSKRIQLLRIRNPWHSAEWKGAWNDLDGENWSTVAESVRSIMLETRLPDDGEAWMEWNEFVAHFAEVTVATIISEADGLTTCATAGRWEPLVNSGGNEGDLQKFATNPQYLLTVNEPDAEEAGFAGEDGEGNNAGTSVVCIELIQEQNRSLYPSLYKIGLAIYKTDQSSKPLRAEDMTEETRVEKSVTSNFSSLVKRYYLQPGYYAIIPFLQDPELGRGFYIRVYSAKPISLQEFGATEDKKWWHFIRKLKCW